MKSLSSIYFDEEFVGMGEAYNLKWASIVTNRQSYDDFITRSSYATITKWKIFKDKFLEHTPLCPICEGFLNKMDDIDHFRPKSHYWWLAYDFYNYVICCDYCNRVLKNADFPLFDETKKVSFENKDEIYEEQHLLFNPLADNPEELFQLEFKLSSKGKAIIEIQPLNSLADESYEYKLAESTIEKFKLNDSKDISRFNLMSTNYSSIYSLLKTRNLYLKRRDALSKDLFFESLKNTFGGLKNGLAVLVLKNQFIWNIPN